ncbi:MAG TPA: aspartyl protease family protein [Gemmatales bacterium]|nr:aspartyl protease family protein [Gemmatales bacterium]
MNAYHDKAYQPPAPLAVLKLSTIDGRNVAINKVLALIDTGADVTLLPRWAVEQLGLTPERQQDINLQWFDGSVHSVESVDIKVSFLEGHFQGRYPVVDQPHGVLGRNLLNHFRLVLDGPNKCWYHE